MIVIPHYISESPVHGLGVFAARDVRKGEVIWQFDPLFDRVIPLGALAEYPDHVQTWVKTRAEFFPHRSCFVLPSDGALFMNHSSDPNLSSDGDRCIALRDIRKNEEITCDYRSTVVVDFMNEFDSFTPLNESDNSR